MTKLALRQFSILGITRGLVNIRITIAIHWHSQQILESESGVYLKGQYWAPCYSMSLSMIYSCAAVTLTSLIMQMITVYHLQEVLLISLKIH